MSSDPAANITDTVVLADSTSPLQQPPPQLDPPSRDDIRDYEGPSNIDGRTSDSDKMLQSGGVLLDTEGPEGEGVGPEMLDASGQAAADTVNAGDDSDSSQSWVESDEEGHDLKRVKVYELIGARWVDQGTAYCFGDFHENEAFLIARSESDFNQVILTTTIHANDVYQRQQGMLSSTGVPCGDNMGRPTDTLIVWTEPDGIDYALSFQDPEGCLEVWNFIQDVQKHLASCKSLSDAPPTFPHSS